ncbi:DNA ligase 4 [Dissostichus eleginoides]|uniref:DNA ligase 4 n=1 Tax=Dissostichus eleginoides TaxID=100907 RepID=A0AAD9BW51_DISEL|nr:DNA ligase 4 [Dissostichus eleginoides]
MKSAAGGAAAAPSPSSSDNSAGRRRGRGSTGIPRRLQPRKGQPSELRDTLPGPDLLFPLEVAETPGRGRV